jgi:TRAP-type C4-dicarboxylate transport system substrate-binding protein
MGVGSVIVFTSLLAAGCGDRPSEKSVSSSAQTLRYAMNNGENTDKAVHEKELARLIEKYTNGKYRVQMYWEGALGGERTALEAVRSKAVEIGMASSSNTAALIPEFAALDLPFLVPGGWEGLPKLLESQPMKDLGKAAEARGYKLIGWVPEGFRQLMMTHAPVKTPSDLKGKKLRTTASPIEADYDSAFGALPTAIDWSETYLALKQGTVDGYFVAYSSVVQFKMVDAIKYATQLHIVPIMSPELMNLEFFNALPADVQDAILKAGKDAYAAKMPGTIQADKDFRKTMEGAGVKVYEPTTSEVEAWQIAAKPVYAKYPQFSAWSSVAKP